MIISAAIATNILEALPPIFFRIGATLFLLLLLAIALFSGRLSPLSEALVGRVGSTEFQEIYKTAIAPSFDRLSAALFLAIVDWSLLLLGGSLWLQAIEFPFGIVVSINLCFVGFKIANDLFERYLLEIALEDRQNINSELLTLGRFLMKTTILLSIIFAFAQAHQINIVGLVASLGVAGAAIAFASQKIVEQILWSIVLYIDRPFGVGDYIHLDDGMLGRVEAIGWRSTKVRLSGKNTLTIVPNSNLAQMSIENLSRARRAILIVDLTFFQPMTEEEKALIQQLILDSTREILGIDRDLTQVTFEDFTHKGQSWVRGRTVFFVLGEAETSMELRRSLLEIARENIIERLNTYGISFDFEEKTIDVTQPMNM